MEHAIDCSFPQGTLFLVTGGAGFIGSHIVEALLARGHRVRVLDDLSTGKQSNVDLFAGHPRYEFVLGDIKDPPACAAACEGATYVLHQAAWGSVPRSLEAPAFYEANNVGGTVNMLQAAREAGVRTFVWASSSSVYGDAEALPKREGAEGEPLSPYAVTKRACELWAAQWWRHYGLRTVGLRYFNVFGPRQDPNGPYAAVIPRWTMQLARGERPTVNGDGLQSRDFTYVANVVQANLRACLAPDGACGRAYNVAAGGRETLLQVYAAIAGALGSGLEPAFGPERPGDVRHSHADVGAAREAFGYVPTHDFAAGIAEAVAWYREHL